jgi:hypothetical protein
MVRLLLAVALPLAAQERTKPDDWPVHAQGKDSAIAAEYMVRTVLSEGRSAVLRDYLAIEVGFFPARDRSFVLSTGHFTLRVNGKKATLMAQTPGMVAASIKYEDWEVRPTVVATGSAGNAGVILGRPQGAERFPGDRRPTQDRLPPTPRAPGQEDRSGIDREPQVKPEEIVTRTALPEGETAKPVRGYLFFPFKGKNNSIKKLALVYSGPAGEIELPFF